MLSTILVIAAFILFVIAAFPTASRINLVAAGLACWVLSTLVGTGLLHLRAIFSASLAGDSAVIRSGVTQLRL